MFAGMGAQYEGAKDETDGAAALRLLQRLEARTAKRKHPRGGVAGEAANYCRNAGDCFSKPVKWGGSAGNVNPLPARCHVASNDNVRLVSGYEDRG
jgi:hypothetical protein